MKRLTLVLTFASLIAATTAHAITWQRVYGGDNGGASGSCVQETSDGGYIVSGTWSLMKLNEFGDSIWTRDYGGGTWIAQTPDGGYIVSGLPDLLKTDEVGDSVWSYNSQIDNNVVGRLVSDGGYIITGAIGWSPLALIRLDENGDSVWFKTYEEPGNNINVGHFVEETKDGGFIITGTTGYEDEEYNRWAYLWLLKTDANGEVIWSKTYGEQEWNSPNEGHCVRQIEDGGFIIVGERSSGGFWLLKTNENGDTNWTRTYGGEKGECVIETLEGNYVAVGQGPAANLLESTLPNGGDVLLIKVNSDGNSIWARSHGGAFSDIGRCVTQTLDTGFIIAGASRSFTSSSALYVLKTDSLGLWEAIIEEPTLEETTTWEVSSIGSNTILKFWGFPQGFQASVFDVSGRIVDQIHATGSSGSVSWGNKQRPGVYFIHVIETNNTRTEKVVIIH